MTAKLLHEDDDTIRVFGPINRQGDNGQIRSLSLVSSIEIMLTFRWFTTPGSEDSTSKVVSPVGRIRGVWPAHRCFTWTSYAAQVESFIPFDVVMTLSEPPFSFLLSRGIIVRGCSVRGFTTEYRRGIRYFTERRGGGRRRPFVLHALPRYRPPRALTRPMYR